MRCSQLETRLNDLLDRREDPRLDAEMAAHTARCRRCRRVVAAYAALAEGTAALAEESFVGRFADGAVSLPRRNSTFRRNMAGTICRWQPAPADRQRMDSGRR